MMPTFLSLVAPQVAITTTCSATINAKVGIMAMLGFQCKTCFLCRMFVVDFSGVHGCMFLLQRDWHNLRTQWHVWGGRQRTELQVSKECYKSKVGSKFKYLHLHKIIECRYREVSNLRRTLVGNKVVDHSDVVGASPVCAAPTTSSFST